MGLRLRRTRTAALVACFALVLAVVATITRAGLLAAARVHRAECGVRWPVHLRAAPLPRAHAAGLGVRLSCHGAQLHDDPEGPLDRPSARGPRATSTTWTTPQLARYPIAYLSEPGYWYPNESEATGLRKWIEKGGFLIVDDFLLGQWVNFDRSMKLVLPNARIVPLTIQHPIFNRSSRSRR